MFLKAVYVSEHGHKIRYPYRGPFRIIDIQGNSVKIHSIASGKARLASMRNIRIYPSQVITKAENLNANEPIPITDDINALNEDLKQMDDNNDFLGFSAEEINIGRRKNTAKQAVEPNFEGFSTEEINMGRKRNTARHSEGANFEGFAKENGGKNKQKLKLLNKMLGK